MKNTSNFFNLVIACVVLLVSSGGMAQQWPTGSGNNMKNGLSLITGPSAYEPVWTVTSSFNSVFGNSVFTCGDRFVTSRTMFSPVYNGVIECRSIADGELLWEFQPDNNAIMYAVGFNEQAVYAHDYNSGDLYAIDPLTGASLWTFPLYLFGGNTGLVFSCEGDPLYTNYRLDRFSGEPVWHNNYTLPVTPDAGFACTPETFYHFTGSITTPKTIIAIYMESGGIKYETDPLPGDGDQELPIVLGPGNSIYMTRDGGDFYAFADDGAGLIPVFTSPIAFEWRVAIDHDSTIVGYYNNKIHRMDHETGQLIASTPFDLDASRPIITIDRQGKIYVNISQAAAGKIYCLSPDLQTILWETPVPYAYYCDPNLNKNGLMVLTQSGTQITGIRSDDQIAALPPVADFYSWTRDIHRNNTVDFSDNTSYLPTSWEWTFEGGYPGFSYDQNPAGIQYVTSGSYAVTLKVTNAHGSDSITKQCYINVDEVVDVAYIATPASLSIYPNPVSDYFWIKTRGTGTDNIEITILDAMGKSVFRLSPENGSPDKKIDISHLPAGFYAVKTVMNEKTEVLKILKL
jgi:outer membrane protein assembly factor BamB